MSERDERLAIRHMLDHAREAVSLAAGHSRADLERDRLLQLALTRLIEVVGEAATRVDIGTRLRNPDVPWAPMVAMRNRLIHGYDLLDWNLLWDTIDQDLPKLIRQLERILGET